MRLPNESPQPLVFHSPAVRGQVAERLIALDSKSSGVRGCWPKHPRPFESDPVRPRLSHTRAMQMQGFVMGHVIICATLVATCRHMYAEPVMHVTDITKELYHG